MKAQLAGSGVSLVLHALFIAALVWTGPHWHPPAPLLRLDLTILPPAAAEAAPGPSAVQSVPARPEAMPPPRPALSQPAPQKQALQKSVQPRPTPRKDRSKRASGPLPPQGSVAETPQARTPAAGMGAPASPERSTGRTSDNGMYSPGELDSALTVLEKNAPAYPVAARRRNIEGWVRVRFVVNEQGRPEQIKIVAAEPAGVFDGSVQRAIAGWRFRPGTRKGRIVRVLVEQRIRFSLP